MALDDRAIQQLVGHLDCVTPHADPHVFAHCQGHVATSALEAVAHALAKLELSLAARSAIIRVMQSSSVAKSMPGLASLLTSAGDDERKIDLLMSAYFRRSAMRMVGVIC